MRVAVAFLFIFLALAVEGARSKKHPKHVRAEHEDYDEFEEDDWPQPDEVRRFDVPDMFTGRTHQTHAESSTPPSGRHHHQKKMTTQH